MNTPSDDKLNALLNKLPRSIEPVRDLWPTIALRIAKRRVYAWPQVAWKAAAAAAVVAVVLATAWITLPTHAPAPGNPTVAAVTPSAPPHVATEAVDLLARFVTQLASDTSLPPKARDALLDNLRMIHTDILRTQAALKTYPNDVNLQALLFNLYQQQAQLLNEAQQAQIQVTTRTEI
ncbi:MAG: hypothetical protein WCC11_09345 [Gammaproteobacteria bacterium]